MTAQPMPLDLDGLFHPRSVALVGASDRSAWSRMIIGRFRDFGYQGTLLAVNRDGKEAHGLPGYASCRDLPIVPDIAFLYVPAAAVAGALEDAAAAGITRALVLTSGFAEAGEEGVALQDDLVATARRLGVTLMGPNALGFANIAEGLVATAIGTRVPARKGGIGIVSQSGAVANEIGKFAHQQGIGLSFTGATGNEGMISVAHIIDWLVDHEPTRVIAAYLESISEPDRLRDAARRALAAGKPIVMLKVGSSAISAEVAKAHTGSMVGDDGVFDAVCRQYGIIRVRSIEEMVVTAGLIEQTGPLERPGIALVSVSGGSCGIYADLAELYGVDVPPFTAETCARLRAVLPSFASTLNPLDLTGTAVADPSLWARALPILFDDPGIGLAVPVVNMPGTEAERINAVAPWTFIAQAFKDAGRVPLMMSMVSQPMNESALAAAQESGLHSIIAGHDLGVRALGHLSRWSARVRAGIDMPAAPAAIAAPPRPVGERATLDWLAGQGVPVIPAVTVTHGADAVTQGSAMGGPLALKIASPDIAHKTELGGVRLNIDPADAGRVHDEIRAAVAAAAPQAAIDGVIVSPMRRDGIELFVGVTRDADWGPAIAVGLGGVWVEVLKDSAVRLLPIDQAGARDMLESLRGAALLKGYRGAPATDLDALADAIVAIGEAGLALGPDLAALEINPLWVRGEQVEALDALAVWTH